MIKARWNNKVIAESDATIVLEGNHYFPYEAVNTDFLKKSGSHYKCPWKGVCDYYDVIVDGEMNKEAAWIYPDPKPAAEQIKGRVAFWRGIQIVEN